MTDGSIEMLSTESQAWLPIMGISGILLLAAGGLVVRLAAVASGVVVGGLLGWLLWSETQLPVPSWLIMSVCCLICIAMAILLTRFFVAILLGLILSLWATSLFASCLPFDSEVDDSMRPLPTMLGTMIVVEAGEEHETGSGADEHPHPGAAFSENIHEASGEVRITWKELPETWKLIVAIALAGGFFIGFMYGLFMPASSVMCMSCAWGGLLMLSSAIGLFARTSAEGPWDSGIAMMMAWTAISVTGGAVQSIFRSKQSRDHQI